MLGGLTGLVVSSIAGCVQRTRNLFSRNAASQVSLTIKTLPADADRTAIRTGRHLDRHLQAVGIDSSVVLEPEDQLRRSVLINQDYDLYVARYPDHSDPDFLRPLLHSVFVDEPGWQNPFEFVDLSVDELLTRQRTSEGSSRESAVGELLRTIGQTQPFTVVAYPHSVRAVRTDRFEGWRSPGLSTPLGYLTITPMARQTAPELRVAITDRRITRNFNPLAVEFRNRGTFTGLLYDPLARQVDGEIVPWLADGWSWSDADGETVARIQLREGLVWHDSRPLTATDVAFTYRFLRDTSLGDGPIQVPAPRFRGRVSLVESVESIDRHTVRFDFGETSPSVAGRAFTIPLLPEREWRPLAAPADIAGVDFFEGVTEALIWDNPEPVGSGPFRFERSIADESLVLRRFDDHFVFRSDEAPVEAHGRIDSVTARVAPSDEAAVGLVAAGDVDATASSVRPHVVPDIGRADDVALVVTPSRAFYHVGFNATREPLGNPRFRHAIARLVDKQHVADVIFDGYASPSASPLMGTGWTPTDLHWQGEDPTAPFVGTDGEVDVRAARDLFRDIGYSYGEAGRLLLR